MTSNSSVFTLTTFLLLISASLSLPINKTEQYLCSDLMVAPPDQTIFNWELKNAKSLLETSADYVWSLPFYTRNNADKWQIQFQPVSTVSPTSIGIYLHLISSEMLGMQVQAAFELLTTDGAVVKSIEYFVHRYDGSEVVGLPSIELRSNVIKELGSKDDLVISCRLNITTNVTTTSCQSENVTKSSEELKEETRPDTYRHLYQNLDLSDVTIFIENVTIAAHKSVLAARCPVFANIFVAAGNNETIRLVIEGMELAEVKGLLEYLYTDEVSNLEELAYGLLRAADAYELPRLKAMCEKVIYGTLDESSAAQVLILAHLYHADELKKNVLSFIADHLNGVTQSEGYKEIVNIYPELLNDIIKSTAQKSQL